MAKKKQPASDHAENCLALAEFAANALITAEYLGLDQKVVDDLSLDRLEREIVAQLPAITSSLKKKLAKSDSKFTVLDCGEIIFASSQFLTEDEPVGGLALLFIVDKVMNKMIEILEPPPTKNTRNPKLTDKIYQFKITLIDSEPLVWRRIQVQDCTLDKLHEHIQTAMGWSNTHLHLFRIKGREYGDPDLLDDPCSLDSKKTNLSKILPKSSKRFIFKYLYDFGDAWDHEVLFEGNPPVDAKAKYPLCLEGEKACPPEDCGGVWGYTNFLEAINDPNHEEHINMMEWIGRKFDPNKFDPKQATKEMKKGSSKW